MFNFVSVSNLCGISFAAAAGVGMEWMRFVWSDLRRIVELIFEISVQDFNQS
jgi:hypothetical protein